MDSVNNIRSTPSSYEASPKIHESTTRLVDAVKSAAASPLGQAAITTGVGMAATFATKKMMPPGSMSRVPICSLIARGATRTASSVARVAQRPSAFHPMTANPLKGPSIGNRTQLTTMRNFEPVNLSEAGKSPIQEIASKFVDAFKDQGSNLVGIVAGTAVATAFEQNMANANDLSNMTANSVNKGKELTKGILQAEAQDHSQGIGDITTVFEEMRNTIAQMPPSERAVHEERLANLEKEAKEQLQQITNSLQEELSKWDNLQVEGSSTNSKAEFAQDLAKNLASGLFMLAEGILLSRVSAVQKTVDFMMKSGLSKAVVDSLLVGTVTAVTGAVLSETTGSGVTQADIEEANKDLFEHFNIENPSNISVENTRLAKGLFNVCSDVVVQVASSVSRNSVFGAATQILGGAAKELNPHKQNTLTKEEAARNINDNINKITAEQQLSKNLADISRQKIIDDVRAQQSRMKSDDVD